MIKEDVRVVKKNGINYLYKDGKQLKYKPWLGDMLSFLYDIIMAKSVFPKKFEASIQKHKLILGKELSDFHKSNILELATGSGNLAEILPCDNIYTGIDISNGLLKKAHKRFNKAGFKEPELVLCGAEELPFKDSMFDICICNLSLNFFEDLDKVIKEVKRVLNDQGEFVCSVPLPERNQKQSVIRGTLYSEEELEKLYESNGFSFTSFEYRNGALFYFKADL